MNHLKKCMGGEVDKIFKRSRTGLDDQERENYEAVEKMYQVMFDQERPKAPTY